MPSEDFRAYRNYCVSARRLQVWMLRSHPAVLPDGYCLTGRMSMCRDGARDGVLRPAAWVRTGQGGVVVMRGRRWPVAARVAMRPAVVVQSAAVRVLTQVRRSGALCWRQVRMMGQVRAVRLRLRRWIVIAPLLRRYCREKGLTIGIFSQVSARRETACWRLCGN